MKLVHNRNRTGNLSGEVERIPSHHHFPSNLDAALPSATVSLSSSSSFPLSPSLAPSLRRPHKNCATSLVSRYNDVVTSCTNMPWRQRFACAFLAHARARRLRYNSEASSPHVQIVTPALSKTCLKEALSIIDSVVCMCMRLKLV